ncbi:MAG: 30S ribosomal protein S6 [Ignavibacteriales bacterium]
MNDQGHIVNPITPLLHGIAVEPHSPQEEVKDVREYEVMYILQPDLDEEKVTAAVEKYSGLIQANGGTVTNVEKWGKRRLAYELKGQREGNYVLVQFSGEPAVSSELDRVMKISEEVLRHLIVRKGA